VTDLFKYLVDVPSDLSVDFYSEHNRKTDAYFNDGKIKLYSDELLHYGDVDLRGLPKKYGKYEFWMERKNNWQKPKLLYRVKDENVELLDFENSGSSLDFWYPSDDGTLLLYGTSEGGNEQTTIRVIKTDTREVMTDTIEFAGFTDQGNICWLNAKSFIYPRMNGFGKHGPEDKWLLGTKLYLHVLGEDPVDDVLVFGTELPDIVMLIPTLSHDKRYLYVAICEDELTHSLVRVEINSLKFKQISIDNPGACIVKTAPGVVYILTNNNAERYRLLMCEERFFSYSLDEWDEILPESDDILQDFWIHSSKQIIALYSHKVSSRLRIFDQYGDQTGVIETPKLSVVSGVSCGADSSTIYYSLSGFTTPSSIYRLDKPDDRSNLIWQREGSRRLNICKKSPRSPPRCMPSPAR